MWIATTFYAAVEMQRYPEIRDKPIAVCGSQEERHGIVLTANYIANNGSGAMVENAAITNGNDAVITNAGTDMTVGGSINNGNDLTIANNGKGSMVVDSAIDNEHDTTITNAGTSMDVLNKIDNGNNLEIANNGTEAMNVTSEIINGKDAVITNAGTDMTVSGSINNGNDLTIANVTAVSITAVAVTDVNALVGLGSDVIEKMEAFSEILLPTIAAALAASGSPGVASARQLAVLFFSDMLMNLINQLLLPLVYAYIAACTAYAAIGNEGLKRISITLKWIVTSILTAVLLAFIGYLTVSGVVAGTTDALMIKATKFAVSSVVPVVGGILSDAAETVLVGAKILKNSIGIFGMLVVLGLCIAPFLELGVHYLVYKFTAALSATVADSRAAGLIDGIGSAFGLVLGMTGACAILLLVSIVSAVSMVNV